MVSGNAPQSIPVDTNLPTIHDLQTSKASLPLLAQRSYVNSCACYIFTSIETCDTDFTPSLVHWPESSSAFS
jgi:hypothetical protein